MATSEHYLFFWSLNQVLNNHCISTKFYKIEEKLVQGEFIFNEDNLITAIPEKLMLQKTLIKKSD